MKIISWHSLEYLYQKREKEDVSKTSTSASLRHGAPVSTLARGGGCSCVTLQNLQPLDEGKGLKGEDPDEEDELNEVNKDNLTGHTAPEKVPAGDVDHIKEYNDSIYDLTGYLKTDIIRLRNDAFKKETPQGKRIKGVLLSLHESEIHTLEQINSSAVFALCAPSKEQVDNDNDEEASPDNREEANIYHLWFPYLEEIKTLGNSAPSFLFCCPFLNLLLWSLAPHVQGSSNNFCSTFLFCIFVLLTFLHLLPSSLPPHLQRSSNIFCSAHFLFHIFDPLIFLYLQLSGGSPSPSN